VIRRFGKTLLLFAALLAAVVATPTRIHARGFFDLAVTITDTPDPVAAGSNITYTITASNLGGGPGSSVNVTTGYSAAATFVSMTPAAGWTITAPPVGVNDVVIASKAAALGIGASQLFTLVVAVGAGTANGTVITATATGSSTPADGTPGNNTASTTTTVTAAVPTMSQWQLVGLLIALIGICWFALRARPTPMQPA